MVSWLNYKKLIVIVVPLLLLSISLSEGKATIVKKWGFYGHKRINRMAVFTLPPPMFGFYKDHIEYLTENAPNPDKRRYAVDGEAQRHYIDLDHYYKNGEDYTKVIPQLWKDAVAKYTEDTLQAYGIVSWTISNMKYNLQKAFEEGNVDKILKYSADLGHYMGDAHVPLHTTENYNGQLTNQKGIHGLWESRLVEINADNYDYFVGKSKYIKSPIQYAWEVVFASHKCVDSVFRIERELTQTMGTDKKYSYEQRGTTTAKVYSFEFSQAYHQQLNGMVERRMKAAVVSVGSIWYTAWVDAGQPDLEKLRNNPISLELKQEFEELENHVHSEKSKGRICD
jgi:hypothetical protein